MRALPLAVLVALVIPASANAELALTQVSATTALEPVELPGLHLTSNQLTVKSKTWWYQELKDLDLQFVEPALALKLAIDMKKRKAHFRLGDGAQSSALGFRLESDIDFRSSNPKVKTRLDLSINGHKYDLELPEVTFVPRSYQGQRYIEYRVPLLQSKF